MSAGALSDRIGPRTVIFTGYAVLLMSYGLLDTAKSVWPLAFGFLVFGLFPALTDGVQRAFASSLTPEDLRGSGLGWFNAANGVGALAAGIGGGYLWQAHSPVTAFLAASGFIVAGLILFFASAALRTPGSALRKRRKYK
jgi:MFS family permease